MAERTVASSRATKTTTLARLGRKNVHRTTSGQRSDGPSKPSPLTAVLAILQAYAIVALVLTTYNSVFANDRGVPATVMDQHDTVALVKNALFGDGVLADVYNLDRFLGVSSTSHHLTRLACRRGLDAVAGTGWVASQAAYYAMDTTTPIAKDALVFTTTELQLDVAWARVATGVAFTWRNTKNVSFLSWQIIKPALVFVLPFWDFVMDGLGPVFAGARDGIVDGAEDAYFAFQESVGEELGPTFAEWGKRMKPFVLFPINVYNFFVATVVRPAVFFCTYPELRGDLEVPETPILERLRWGESCRKTAWSDWGRCSVECGSGYKARVNHCLSKEVVRCNGPGVVGCDEVCNSGARRDCGGTCRGTDTVDCRGVCGGGSAFGCDGKCTSPPAQRDVKNKCCVAPTFVLQTSGLCNTTSDPQTEMLAEAARLKRKLADAKARLAAGYVPGRRGGKTHKGKGYAALEQLASEVAIADSNAGLPTQTDYLADLEHEQQLAEENAELVAAKKALAEKLRQREVLRRKQRLESTRRAKTRSWAKALASSPYAFASGLLKFTFSRMGFVTSVTGAFVAALGTLVSYSFGKLERDLNKNADDDDDNASVVSVGSKAKKAFELVSGKLAELRNRLTTKPEKAKGPSQMERRYAESGKSAVSEKTAAKLSERGVVGGASAAVKIAADGGNNKPTGGNNKVTAGTNKPTVDAQVPNKVAEVFASASVAASGDAARASLYRARRRSVVCLVNMSSDPKLDWRRRLRCHGSLLRLCNKDDGWVLWMVVSSGAVGSATTAMDTWVARKTAGDGAPMLQPGPDAALQLLRMLCSQQSKHVVSCLRKQKAIHEGTAAHTLMDVLAETPGVTQVQRAALSALWRVLELGSLPGKNLEKRLIDRGLVEHCLDEWEDSGEDEGVARGIGGVVMQLALGGDGDVRSHLTKAGAQVSISIYHIPPTDCPYKTDIHFYNLRV